MHQPAEHTQVALCFSTLSTVVNISHLVMAITIKYIMPCYLPYSTKSERTPLTIKLANASPPQ